MQNTKHAVARTACAHQEKLTWGGMIQKRDMGKIDPTAASDQITAKWTECTRQTAVLWYLYAVPAKGDSECVTTTIEYTHTTWDPT